MSIDQPFHNFGIVRLTIIPEETLNYNLKNTYYYLRLVVFVRFCD